MAFYWPCWININFSITVEATEKTARYGQKEDDFQDPNNAFGSQGAAVDASAQDFPIRLSTNNLQGKKAMNNKLKWKFCARSFIWCGLPSSLGIPWNIAETFTVNRDLFSFSWRNRSFMQICHTSFKSKTIVVWGDKFKLFRTLI